ncbi:MAG: hypothetical protein Q9219_003080 [cf. Caloplaca sp. 3 TL-2023]
MDIPVDFESKWVHRQQMAQVGQKQSEEQSAPHFDICRGTQDQRLVDGEEEKSMGPMKHESVAGIPWARKKHNMRLSTPLKVRCKGRRLDKTTGCHVPFYVLHTPLILDEVLLQRFTSGDRTLSLASLGTRRVE